MGCWKETCGLTNQSISEGEQVVVFILKDINGMWIPEGIPIYGIYNNYGGIYYQKPSEYEKFVLKHFNTKVNLHAGYESLKVDTISQLFDALLDGAYYHTTQYENISTICPYGFMMVKKRNFEIALKMWVELHHDDYNKMNKIHEAIEKFKSSSNAVGNIVKTTLLSLINSGTDLLQQDMVEEYNYYVPHYLLESYLKHDHRQRLNKHV
jgi:hypothetical protein